MTKPSTITLSHGSGGTLTHDLINDVILEILGNNTLAKLDDSAILDKIPKNHKIAFTSDSHVVDPIFFPGGDIGRLAVSGTVNDLAVSGATCRYLSLSLILEAGLSLEDLKKIIESIKKTADKACITIVTGDTKVVPKGKGDKIFINTAGIGFIPQNLNISSWNAAPGDCVIVNGTMGDHEIAILNAREDLNLNSPIQSDVCPLNNQIAKILKATNNIHCLKDLTRGGLAGGLVEIARHSLCEIQIDEEKIPVKREVAGICDLLGFDPIYLANEGKFVTLCPESETTTVLKALGDEAKIIGKVTNKDTKGHLLMETLSGGVRKVEMMTASQLPRIC